MSSEILSGFLLVDKPIGISSFDVIRVLRRQTGIKTFGHAGTLDPFASGLLIIAVNKYTRLLSLLDNAEKAYTATIVLGKATTTGDTEGEITQISDRVISKDDLSGITSAVLKIDKLKPPIYSAIKVNGKRAYERARADEVFELPERASQILNFSIDNFNYPFLTYSCRVSKGTYIRSLSQWIAESLGTVAHTSILRRTAIGKVSVTNAIQPDCINQDTLSSHLTSLLDILPESESITLNEEEYKRIRNGNNIANQGNDNTIILLYNQQNQCIGIGYRKEDNLFPKVNL